MSTTPTLQQLHRGLELSTKIAEMEAELAALFGGSEPIPKPVKGDGRSGKRSPETIAKMKAAQQARRAKVKGKKVEAPAPAAKTQAPVKRKRTMSPETKAKMAAAAKARWAAAKAGNDPLPTAAKKK